jgi:hypothetical protein
MRNETGGGMRTLICLAFLSYSMQTFSQEKSGPFGFEAGMTKEQIIEIVGSAAIKETSGDTTIFSNAPKADPIFESYALRISPENGLLKIVALSKNINTNGFGNELKSAFKDIRAALAKIYGRPVHEMDLLNNGSIWTRPDDWMTALLKGERIFGCNWIDIPLPNRINVIRIDVAAKSKEIGCLYLTYEFEGYAAYMKTKK